MVGDRRADPARFQQKLDLLERQPRPDRVRTALLDRPAPGFILAEVLAMVDVERDGLERQEFATGGEPEHNEAVGLPPAELPAQDAVGVSKVNGQNDAAELARDVAAGVDVVAVPRLEPGEQDLHADLI
jgi:hypothetical protein